MKKFSLRYAILRYVADNISSRRVIFHRQYTFVAAIDFAIRFLPIVIISFHAMLYIYARHAMLLYAIRYTALAERFPPSPLSPTSTSPPSCCHWALALIWCWASIRRHQSLPCQRQDCWYATLLCHAADITPCHDAAWDIDIAAIAVMLPPIRHTTPATNIADTTPPYCRCHYAGMPPLITPPILSLRLRPKLATLHYRASAIRHTLRCYYAILTLYCYYFLLPLFACWLIFAIIFMLTILLRFAGDYAADIYLHTLICSPFASHWCWCRHWSFYVTHMSLRHVTPAIRHAHIGWFSLMFRYCRLPPFTPPFAVIHTPPWHAIRCLSFFCLRWRCHWWYYGRLRLAQAAAFEYTPPLPLRRHAYVYACLRRYYIRHIIYLR